MQSKINNTWKYPIPEHRKAIYEFYKLSFDENGCPMTDEENGTVFHPLVGAYLIQDYCNWYTETKDTCYLSIAHNIVLQCINRAVAFKNALVFWYTPETKLSLVPFTFYSALTQAQYVFTIGLLHSLSPRSQYKSIITKLYNSLLIPTEEKGVLLSFAWGNIIEEYYSEPPLFTLNGFITAIKLLIRRRETLISCGITDIDHFIQKLVLGLEHILPLYDASFIYNTRYNLTGFTRVRLHFDRPVQTELKQFNIEIPSLGTFNGIMAKKSYRWDNYLERHEERILQFNVLLSLISFPEENIFRAVVDSKDECSYSIYIGDGDYSPQSTAMPTTRWRLITTGKLAAGYNTISHKLTWDEYNLFAYPTNFKKNIGGTFYNSYHFIHIIGLAELYYYTNVKKFKEYAQKWFSYVKQWPNIFIYFNNSISLRAYNEPIFLQRYNEYLKLC